MFSAMERLHDTSTNPYGSVEHIFSLHEIDVITRKIADDEWMGLGSVISETMFETILDVGENALKERGWVDRMSLTDRIAEDVSSVVEVRYTVFLRRRFSLCMHLGNLSHII